MRILIALADKILKRAFYSFVQSRLMAELPEADVDLISRPAVCEGEQEEAVPPQTMAQRPRRHRPAPTAIDAARCSADVPMIGVL